MVQGSMRRLVVAFLVACVLAFALAVVKSAEAQVLKPSGCKDLTSSDPMWWMLGCYMYPSNQ